MLAVSGVVNADFSESGTDNFWAWLPELQRWECTQFGMTARGPDIIVVHCKMPVPVRKGDRLEKCQRLHW